ncbi:MULTISPECIES: hypothetical protein [unclassified Kribbella]|uniref:hypothetical protein n=1 Tax=unclassified Kribbella TaxID=2644121 RepID=UPI00379248A8|nr:hypothetical protein OG817_11885 [Kribbella sp. NBC_00889]
MSEAREHEAGRRTGRAWSSAGAIYGTIASMAVVAGGAKQTAISRLLVVTVMTLVIFWLAHVYANALAHHLNAADGLDWRAVRSAMAEEWPLVTGPLPALAILALGALDVLPDRSAVLLMLWCGVAQLLGWGIMFARRQRWGWPMALTTGAVNATFGILIVILEVLIH